MICSQENLDDASKENRQLTHEVEQLESENAELHSDISALDQHSQSASHKLKSVTAELKSVNAELSHFQQQATAEYDSLRAQSQQEVDALHSNAHQLQRQLQSSYAQVQTLQEQLERAQNYIQALQNQFGIGSEGRAPPGQGMRSPRPVRTSSLTGSLRSPRSPTGSSTSSTTSSRRNSEFGVRIMQNYFALCIDCYKAWPHLQLSPCFSCNVYLLPLILLFAAHACDLISYDPAICTPTGAQHIACHNC